MNQIPIEQLSPTEKQLLIRIQAKLIGLGVTAKFAYKTTGPVVSTFYYNLDYSIPIAKILKKEEDIAIAAGVSRVLITREEDKIAISIPNPVRETVTFDSCIYTMMQEQAKPETRKALPLLLGVNTYGKVSSLDLVDQPHVLIAGSTGVGKSILLQALISGLALMRSEKELKLILVDTKKLDLTLFSTLPHVIDTIENPEQFHTSMSRLMSIVRKRTDLMKGIARNITEYNQMQDVKLPYYVMVIDEVADLIDLDKNWIYEGDAAKYEDYPRIPIRLNSLLQICRAAGVHVICATQRSSVDVVKGTIKANLPTRIALRLPSRFDSLTVLNQSGAQNLLGKGDMLVESASFQSVLRFHGAFISSNDIVNILDNASQIREQFLCQT